MDVECHSPDGSGILFCHCGCTMLKRLLHFVRNDKKDIADSRFPAPKNSSKKKNYEILKICYLRENVIFENIKISKDE